MFSIDITFFLHLINFIILYLIFKYFFASKILKLINAQKKYIEDSLNMAEKAKKEFESIKIASDEEILNAKLKSQEIIEFASIEADNIKKITSNDCNISKIQMLIEAKKEIENMKTEISNSMKKESLNLALKISEKILKRSVDSKIEEEIIKDFSKVYK